MHITSTTLQQACITWHGLSVRLEMHWFLTNNLERGVQLQAPSFSQCHISNSSSLHCCKGHLPDSVLME